MHDLQKYHHYLERVFIQAKYMLSEPEENILNLKADVSYTHWVDMVSGFLSAEEREVIDEDGKKKVEEFSEIENLLKSTKATRESAGKALKNPIKASFCLQNMKLIRFANKKIDDSLQEIFPSRCFKTS